MFAGEASFLKVRPTGRTEQTTAGKSNNLVGAGDCTVHAMSYIRVFPRRCLPNRSITVAS